MNGQSLFMKSSADFNINLNVKSNNGSTAFHLACNNGHTKAAETLIKSERRGTFTLFWNTFSDLTILCLKKLVFDVKNQIQLRKHKLIRPLPLRSGLEKQLNNCPKIPFGQFLVSLVYPLSGQI